MRGLTFVLLAAIAQYCSATWSPVGPDVTHATIEAAALDFEDGAVETPIIAYGFSSGAADTTIDFCRLNTTSSSWSTIASHTPQFAQPYGDFAFHERNGTLYLGLRIEESAFVLSSVLRGGSGYEGFDGCWAFNGWTWDYDITDGGNIRLITSPDNETIELSNYDKSGWNGYPAGDAWGPFTKVTPKEPTPTIFEIVTARAGADKQIVAYSVEGSSKIAVTTLSNTTEWNPLGTIEGAVSPAVAYASSGSSQGLFAAVAVTPAGCVLVWSQSESEPALRGNVAAPSCVLSGVSTDLQPQVSVIANSPSSFQIIVSAKDGTNPSLLRTVAVTPSTSEVAIEANYTLPAEITSVRLKAFTSSTQEASTAPPHALLTFGNPEANDGLRLLQWS